MQSAAPPSGVNPGRSRDLNRRLVLGHLHRRGEMGRAELARATGLSTQAVSNIIATLQEEGLIAESGRRTAGRGLPALLYTICADGGFALGIEIRPDAVFISLCDLLGTTIERHRTPLLATEVDTVIATLVDGVERVLALQPRTQGKLLGAGIVMPGPFGETGLTGGKAVLPEWRGVAVAEVIGNALDLPLIVENDANAGAMAEFLARASQNITDLAYLYFGSGLGLGIVQNGQLVRGAFGNAGEIGQLPIHGTSKSPTRLEDLASRMALGDMYAANDRPRPDFPELEMAHIKNDPLLADWTSSAASALSQALYVIENLFDPTTVVLGGAVPESVLKDLIDQMVLRDDSLSHHPNRNAPRLMTGQTGPFTASSGAAALILNETYAL